MSGELNLKHTATGVTILALILGQNRTTRWNGTAMAAINSVSDANWTTGMIALVEQVTQNGTRTATYVSNFPAGIGTPGEYFVEYYRSTAATPGSQALGVQDVFWNGTALATIPGIQGKTENLPADPASNASVAGIPEAVWAISTRTLTSFGTLAGDVASAVWAATTRTLSGFGTLVADIWGATARTITGGTITTYTGNTPQTGDAYARLGAPAGASVSADIAAVKNKTDNLPASPAAVGSAMTLTSAYDAAKTAAQAGAAMTLTSAYNAAKTAAQAGDAMTLQSAERAAIAAALLDLANAVDGKTIRQALRIIAAVLVGKVSGAGSGAETFRSLDDLNNRVVVTADTLGNRTNVTYP